ncbi:ADF-H/Gelsolin-like domain,Villin/Gelsolin,Villin headpiece,Gelsolin-like [Cinara cedri]|uniref:ADF-H/Gelsolin-like domain,Villin/Gelsolin,Villin headpiece,Gelsolin-like n=1 Tax=Cinara cedri TaxID=506608 RepID=A0A5E4N697_9HEMI|nr:ADF-H/Gelsolin-like domain,Villin/Gelsolin,Villin headpiece,Gelsolin-like [Cinara cedri]
MDHYHHNLSCKSILKRKSLELSTEDDPAPAVVNKTAEDPLPQSSFKHFNLKSYRQGILKKHSASFDDESIQKPILKNRCQSCDDETIFNFNELHSILKRKTSERCENNSEPSHGILKKRELIAHQQPPDNNHQDHHICNNTADDDIRPILKQKKIESDSTDENNYPRPILKKKSLDSSPDDKKPILKSSRSNSPAKRASSKRLSVAQRVSNFESGIHKPDSGVYKKPVKDSKRSSRDRSRFYTQPVTPSEINAIKKTTHSENNTTTPPVQNVSTLNHSTDKLTTGVVPLVDNRDILFNKALKRANSVSPKTREFQSIFDKTANTPSVPDVNNCSNVTDKSRSSNYKQCQEKRSSVANRYSTQPVTNHELLEAKNLNSAKSKNDNNNGRLPRKKLGSFIMDRLRIFNGNTCTIDVDNIEKKNSLKKEMDEPTKNLSERLKEQPQYDKKKLLNIEIHSKNEKKKTSGIKVQSIDEINKISEKKIQLKEEMKKNPDIKVTPIKSLSNESERTKNRISRNVAINRSFNTNSKLELLRQQKFGNKSKENDEFSKPKKPIESSNDSTDGTSVVNGGSIKDRLVALKKSGQTDWQKRISKIKPEDHEVSNNPINMAQDLLRKQLTKQVKSTEEPVECLDNILVDRLNRLEMSSKDWKKRIEQKDTTNFTVAGKMQNKSLPPLTPVLMSITQRSSAERSSSIIRRKIGEELSPKQTNVRRSLSMSDSKTKSYLNNKSEKIPLDTGSSNTGKEKIVNVPTMIDDDFDKFFGNSTRKSNDTQIDDLDFDHLKSSKSDLLVLRKKVHVQQRKHGGSKNPLKALATNYDLAHQQYTENKSNLLLQRSLETSTIKVPLAREALAALASKEDFASVNLRKSGDLTPTLLPPYKDLMLLHIKGRRRVQTRLVSPTADSVNQGDCYVLVTSSQIFVWIGEYSNVIERSNAAKVAQSILDKKDLGCKFANQLYTINCDSSLPNSQLEKKFWTLLGVTSSETSSIKGQEAGHPDEDELYEAAIVSTNMVYEIINDELVILPEISETMPKIEILDSFKTLVFDFGSEIYVWYGKNVNINKRKPALNLARQLFDDGYDYSQYDVSPIDVAMCLGNRNKDTVYVKSGAKRPEWALFSKITQHMETVLFREKFADWPDYSRVIKLSKKNDNKENVENGESDTCIDWSLEINALNAGDMLEMSVQEPDLVLGGSHLGRGTSYYDKETLREFVINTVGVTVWYVQEFDSTELESKCIGHFHGGDSYIIRWIYNISIQGRELSGLPSRRMVKSGRNRCAYWYWHGRSATQNDQGAAALLTVQLDTEQGPQLRINQGHEPPAFWNLFKGKAIVYRGKRNQIPNTWRLFMVHGANINEAHLIEVLCSTLQLRNQTSFILLNSENGTIFVWHGNRSSDAMKELSVNIAKSLSELDHMELGLTDGIVVQEPILIDDMKEPPEFFQALGGKKLEQMDSTSPQSSGYDMKLFHFSSVLGQFKASLLAGDYVPSPYPYLQDQLYNADQPATFMLDTGEELWLWQGWWPETAAEDDSDSDSEPSTTTAPVTADHRGSSSTRLQAERRAAMQTALDYWKRKYGDADDDDPKAYLVWAGLEPHQFTNYFPEWCGRNDIAEINIKHGHKPGEMLNVEIELARVTQESYPADQLLQRPLPDGVDPTRLELYLSPASFEGLLDMSKNEFLQLPKWKRTKIKQSVGLF